MTGQSVPRRGGVKEWRPESVTFRKLQAVCTAWEETGGRTIQKISQEKSETRSHRTLFAFSGNLSCFSNFSNEVNNGKKKKKTDIIIPRESGGLV